MEVLIPNSTPPTYETSIKPLIYLSQYSMSCLVIQKPDQSCVRRTELQICFREYSVFKKFLISNKPSHGA